jgi:hypothetical protein
MGKKVAGPWRRVRGKRWKGLRSRMEKRRNEAPATINKDDVLSFSARGNSKLGTSPRRWTPADVVLH